MIGHKAKWAVYGITTLAPILILGCHLGYCHGATLWKRDPKGSDLAVHIRLNTTARLKQLRSLVTDQPQIWWDSRSTKGESFLQRIANYIRAMPAATAMRTASLTCVAPSRFIMVLR